jgi:hypothetical protein
MGSKLNFRDTKKQGSRNADEIRNAGFVLCSVCIVWLYFASLKWDVGYVLCCIHVISKRSLALPFIHALLSVRLRSNVSAACVCVWLAVTCCLMLHRLNAAGLNLRTFVLNLEGHYG